jgi:hypothetical protein
MPRGSGCIRRRSEGHGRLCGCAVVRFRGAHWISHDSPGECFLFVSPGLRPPPDLTKNTPPPRRSTHGLPADNIRVGRSPRTCLLVLASSGHRGRDDARGQPAHTPSGLTRTSHRDADAPSRDRRGGTSPRQWRHHRANGVSSCAQDDGRCRSSITKSSAGIPIRDSRQARQRMIKPPAGIVAASTARRCQDQRTSSRTSSPANVVRGPPMVGTANRASLFCELKEEEAAGRRGTRTKETRPLSRD